MYRDTAVTPDSDRHCERDQFADLRTEQIGLLARAAQRLIALDCIGAHFGNFADPYRKLLAISIPVEHRHVTLLISAYLGWRHQDDRRRGNAKSRVSPWSNRTIRLVFR